MIYLLYGADIYRSRKRLNEMMAESRNKGGVLLDFQRFDLETNTTEDIRRALEAQSLFTPKKLIVVEHALSGNLSELKDHIRAISDSKETLLLLWEGEVKKEKEGELKTLTSSATKVQEFKSLERAGVANWIAEQAKKRNVRLAPKEIAMLAQFGNNFWLIASELDKMALNQSGLSLGAAEEKTVFHLGDTFFSSPREGIHTLFSLLSQGHEEIPLFAYLANHARTLFTIKSYAENRLPVPSTHGIHPFVVKKASAILQGIPLFHFHGHLRSFFEEDVKIKIGLSRPRDSLFSLLTRSAKS